MSTLRVGVVGLGEVAQVIHLPIIESLPEHYELAAVCDISPGLLKSIGDRYRVKNRYTDVHEMVAAGGLDCVFVLNSDEYHAECTVAALDAGLHVLVEKPMCLSPREAEQIIAARDRSGKTVMVAYMRRFAPAFTEAVARLPELGPIRYARVHDVIGENRLIVDQTSYVERPDDVPQEAVDAKWARRAELVREALGDVPEEVGWTYGLLCGLGSHDLSAMRELLGRPREVAAARMWRSGGYVVALLDYGDFVVTYETGVDDQLRFDAHIEVYGASGTMKVQYDTPYVRHFPTVLELERTVGDAYERSVVRPHLKDPYTHELEYFHEVVTTGATPKTTPEDYVEDMELFVEIIRALDRA
ncbi:Gfo/Idh/MocA family oxidoreductase [Nocardioides sp. TF02-7]|uniref:Gfo/Idh/MocA family protein n=1 Tax=Nocardioides sp. TF02-7 TaxID=2917724 RepID=UPI001F056E8C|nr:Gfo/Idh/MocA family oxidoreductase [Nocardioides sp. TF02-7]UMG91560.1 Gfo/Idh/MocA family oxidoreductase [Nocardioides sp. TF02-7]